MGRAGGDFVRGTVRVMVVPVRRSHTQEYTYAGIKFLVVGVLPGLFVLTGPEFRDVNALFCGGANLVGTCKVVR